MAANEHFHGMAGQAEGKAQVDACKTGKDGWRVPHHHLSHRPWKKGAGFIVVQWAGRSFEFTARGSVPGGGAAADLSPEGGCGTRRALFGPDETRDEKAGACLFGITAWE